MRLCLKRSVRRVLCICLLSVFSFSALAFSARDPVETSMDLYRKHRYQEAIRILRQGIKSGQAKKNGTVSLTLGMAFLRNAELYNELSRVSLSAHTEYLRKLSSVRGKARSRFANLFLAQTLLETGQTKKARSFFKRFLKEKKVSNRHKDIARVGLALSYHLDGNTGRARKLWSGVKTTDPEVVTSLALAYSKARLNGKNPGKICEKVLATAKTSQNGIPPQAVMNVIGVYARTGHIEEALGLLENLDLSAFSHEETLGKNKSIRFYDISLLNSLSVLYTQAALKYLEQGAGDTQVRDIAQYYLAETYALMGDIGRAATITASSISSSKIPRKLAENLRVKHAVFQYLQGKKNRGVVTLRQLSERNPRDAGLLAEILISCANLQIECTETVTQAFISVKTGQGRGVSRIHYALGLYYLKKQELDKAVLHLEAGRDKSNKNRISSNGPLMLIHIADAYFRSKQYSEALEIYFEMSKHFTAVRQIQVAMQGVYLREQKSAGDVKIF